MKPDRATAFIRQKVPVRDIPGLEGLRLHIANPASGLSRFIEDGPPPYWAWCWGGGMTLAHYLQATPESIRGLRVLDLGSGSGLVGIMAARAGAAEVLAADIDPLARAAMALNAELNDVDLLIVEHDMLDGPPPDVHLVLVGDLFYAADLAGRVTLFLDRCLTAGIRILVGDVGRADLPRHRLHPIAQFDVADFGMAEGARQSGGVYRFTPSRLA